MDTPAFSHLVHTWQALALAPPAAGFRSAALAALEAQLPFSSAWWGLASLRPGHQGVLQGDLYRLPPQFSADWWQIAQVDALAERSLAQPGLTVLDTGDQPTDAAEVAFDARYGLESALSTCHVQASPGLLSFLSLYRSPALPHFDAQDRDLVQALMPHLRLADQTHARLSAAQRAGAAPEHLAQLDELGYLVRASEEFCIALLDEFPGWIGGQMPAPLLPLVRARSGLWQGRGIAVRAFAHAGGQCGLALQSRIGQGLTPREETVARAYAAGLSYKEIARDHGLSPATVRGYLSSCYRKLGVSHKAGLGEAIQRAGAPSPSTARGPA